jgi:hypothetical protein
MSVWTNAGAVARAYRKRMSQWAAGLRAGLRRIALEVERRQVDNLSGGGTSPAGSYPVPIRSGNLRRSTGFRVEPLVAFVFNTALYARAIHNGFVPYGNGRNSKMRAREFLLDAGKATNQGAIMRFELARVLR